jgi:hypothetical protein
MIGSISQVETQQPQINRPFFMLILFLNLNPVIDARSC